MHERICMSCSERVSKCVCWCSQQPSNVHTCTCMVLTTPVDMHAHSPQKMHMCSCMRAYAFCRSFFATKLSRTYLESCASIVQAIVCRPPNCYLDQTHRPTLFAQKIRPNPRWLMTWSPLQCCTSIIRSSALVQASSILSMGRNLAWPRGSLHQEFYFGHFFVWCFYVLVSGAGDRMGLQSMTICRSYIYC